MLNIMALWDDNGCQAAVDVLLTVRPRLATRNLFCASVFMMPVTMMVSHGRAKSVRNLSLVRVSANSMSMNLRRAAVLALVGWYLMVPPMGPPMEYYMNPAKAAEAPLSEWSHVPNDSFGSRQDCEAQLAHDKNATAAAVRARPERDFPGSYAHRVMFAQCVFADDPRLKAK